MRRYMKARREKERQKKKALKQEQAKQSLSNLDLNIGIKPLKPSFMSFKEYRNIVPHASFSEYLRAKKQFQKDNEIRELETPKELTKDEDEFRKGIKNRRKSQNIF